MAAGISSALTKLFNDLANSQPAMLFRDKPRGQGDNPNLGNVLDALAKTEKLVEATYERLTTADGAIGVKNLGVTVPAGAIITQVVTDALTSLTSGGSAKVAISVGSDALKAATAFNDASLVGVDSQLAAPVKTVAGGALTLTVATAALTAGKVRVIVKYLEA